MTASTAYLPVLDGLRAVSILLVVVSHLGLGNVVPGAFGVTLFFFISGYLITRQLLARPRIGFAGFYARRLARLMPAALAYIAIAGGVFVAAGGRITPRGWLAAAFYGANYYDLIAHYRSTLPGVRHPFNVLWSLAIEEHFYLIWPAALLLLRGWRWAAAGVLGLCAAVLLWRLWLLGHCFGAGAHPWVCGPANPNPLWRFNRLYLATDTRLDSIAWGALLAIAEHRGWRWRGSAAVGVLLLVVAFAWPGPVGRFGVRPSVQGLALLAIFPWLLGGGGIVQRALVWGPALFVGRLSYSLYLWHVGALALADGVAGQGVIWYGIAVPGLIAASLASYFLIEMPMMRVRHALGSHARPAVFP